MTTKQANCIELNSLIIYPQSLDNSITQFISITNWAKNAHPFSSLKTNNTNS